MVAPRFGLTPPPVYFFVPLQYSKHLFVHIGQTNPSYSDPLLEAVDIRQIYDKFPEKKGGLKELYERGPQNSFFLVKFWVRSGFQVWLRGSACLQELASVPSGSRKPMSPSPRERWLLTAPCLLPPRRI